MQTRHRSNVTITITSFRHQVNKFPHVRVEIRVKIAAQVRDVHFIRHLARILDQAAQRRVLDTVWHRVDDYTQLGPIAVGDFREQLRVVPLDERLVRVFKHHRRVRCREVARVRNRSRVVDDLLCVSR